MHWYWATQGPQRSMGVRVPVHDTFCFPVSPREKGGIHDRSTQPTLVNLLTDDEQLFLTTFHAVDNDPNRVLARKFMIHAMRTIYGWSSGYSRKVCDSLIAKEKLFNHGKQRISHRPAPPKQQFRKGVCVYCKQLSKRITIDHVLPRSRGGTDTAENMVSACARCNEIKGDRTPVEWARDILNFHQATAKPKVPFWLRLRLIRGIGFQPVIRTER